MLADLLMIEKVVAQAKEALADKAQQDARNKAGSIAELQAQTARAQASLASTQQHEAELERQLTQLTGMEPCLF